MAHLTQDFLDFFMELAPNNNKDWFDANRKRYQKSVKVPFDNLVAEVIEKMHSIDNRIECAPKDCVFRINRDIRFSKDKTPYKMNRSAIVSFGGKKRKDVPGLYFQIDPEKVSIYGGSYQPDKDQLLRIREEIAFNPDQFTALLNDKDFKSTFGTIQGDKNARIPKELKEAGEKQELIYNKQFYWFAEYDSKIALKDDFVDNLIAHYTIMKPMCDFFERPVMG